MKIKFSKILIVIIVSILFLFMINNVSQAASFSASISTTEVNVGGTLTLTLNANNAAGMYDVSVSNSNVSIISGATSEFLEAGSTTLTFKAEKAGTVTITAKAKDMTDLDDDKIVVTGSKTFNITVKEKETSGGGSNSNTGSGSNTGTGSNTGSGSNQGSSGSSSSNSGSNNNSSSGNSSNAPSFTNVNETVYATGSVNVRQSWSTSSKVVGSLSEGQSITRTGKGSNGWSRVTFNGSTAYVSSEYLTTEKKEDKSKNSALKQLTLLQGTLTPEFKKDVTEYTVQVGTDVTELQLDAVPEDEKAKVTVEGNTDLKDGENKVTITVMAEDESKTVYTLIVNKTDKTAETGLTLNKLEIAGVTLTPTFTPDVYSYSINVATGTTSVDITAEAGDEDATVEITGNTDLKDGENLITIMVKKGEGDKQQVTTYQITVNVGEQETVVTTEKSSGPNILIIICGVAAAIIVISIITLIVINRRNKMDYDDEDDDEDYANTTILNQNFNYADELKAKREEKNEAKKQSREEYLNSYKDTIGTNDINANSENNYEEDDDTTRKKRKGRHF